MNSNRQIISLYMAGDPTGSWALLKVRMADREEEVIAVPSLVALSLRDQLFAQRGPYKTRQEAWNLAMEQQPYPSKEYWANAPSGQSVEVRMSYDALTMEFKLPDGVTRQYHMAHEVGGILLSYLNRTIFHINLGNLDSTLRN